MKTPMNHTTVVPDLEVYKRFLARFGDDEMAAIACMHYKFKFDIAHRPVPLSREMGYERYEKMLEELIEFKEAVDGTNFPAMADALVDLVVFAKGTAVMMGLPWAELMFDVTRANLSKEVGVNPKRPDHKVDLYKPEGWVEPQTAMILLANGWEEYV